MKTKVVIENGVTRIFLHPENEFEKDVVEKLYRRKESFDLSTIVDAEYKYSGYTEHKIIVSIKEDKP